MAEETASKNRLPVWEENARASIKTGIRRFSKPLADLVSRDANEGDTRLLITDFLCEALGYDKFEDLTTEYAVRYEFADYGVRMNKQLTAFIEVKRGAQQLSQKHLRQVETYAVKEGLEWLILTNGQHWQVYHVTAATGRQVQTELLFEVDLLGDETPARKTDKLFYIHRDALKADVGEAYDSEGAAGSIYITVPVTISGYVKAYPEQKFSEKRIFTLKRVNDVPGASAAQLRWHIVSIRDAASPEGSDTLAY